MLADPLAGGKVDLQPIVQPVVVFMPCPSTFTSTPVRAVWRDDSVTIPDMFPVWAWRLSITVPLRTRQRRRRKTALEFNISALYSKGQFQRNYGPVTLQPFWPAPTDGS